MSRFLKGVGLGMAGIVLLLCGLIALYYFESKAALRADIKACPTVTAGQATDAVIQDILVNRERIFSKEGANKRGNSSRLTQSFHFFMFEPIFSPVNA
ncbi:hypothetical protein PU690_24820, partial [Klebsiella pneumoniae]